LDGCENISKKAMNYLVSLNPNIHIENIDEDYRSDSALAPKPNQNADLQLERYRIFFDYLWQIYH